MRLEEIHHETQTPKGSVDAKEEEPKEYWDMYLTKTETAK